MRYILSFSLFLFINLFAFSQSNIYKVGFLLDKSSTEINGLLDELSNEIASVVGEDAIIEFPITGKLVNDFNSTQALNNYNILLQGDIDIIIAFGIVNNTVISKIGTYPKPTIVFGALSEELLANTSPAPSVKNYTSIVTSQSYTEDLKVFQKLVKPKRVGVVIEKAFVNNFSIDTIFETIATDLSLDLVLIPFENVGDIMSNLDGVDAVYFAGGYYLTTSEIQSLAQLLIERKTPSFTANPVIDVKNGIMATNHDQSELNQFFRRIALTVESAVNGENLAGLNTKLESKRALTINFNTADQIGIPLKYSLIATTNFIGDPNKTASDKTYDLLGVMQEAIIENLELETFRQEISLTDKDVEFAKSDYLPDVAASTTGTYVDPALAEISFGQSPEWSTLGNITLSQMVFSEAANANISIQKALRDAQQENYNSEELNTVFSSATAYFNALILKANVAIQSQNLDLTKYNLKIATENYEAGQAGKSDVLRFRSEMVQNTQQMIEAINQLQQGYYDLNVLLNNPIDYKIDVEEAELLKGVFSNYNYEQLGTYLDDPTLREPFVKFLVEEAMTNAPELKVLDYNLKATERSERLFASGRFLPTVAIQGQYSYEFNRSGAGSVTMSPIPQDYYTIGLNVSLPIFNQNKQNINQQITKIQKEQLNVNVDNVKLNIEKNINDAVLQLINQIANIQLSEVFEETAKEALDLTQTSYASGAVNIVQLLDAQNNYLQAQQASANATYNYLLSSMQLERYLGTFFLLQTEEEKQAFQQRFLEFTATNND